MPESGQIIADGLPLWRGAQLTVNTSPIKVDGTARCHTARRNGIALEACRAKERKYPELAGRGGRARLVVVGAEVGGRFSSETSQFLRGLVSAKVGGVPPAKCCLGQCNSGQMLLRPLSLGPIFFFFRFWPFLGLCFVLLLLLLLVVVLWCCVLWCCVLNPTPKP